MVLFLTSVISRMCENDTNSLETPCWSVTWFIKIRYVAITFYNGLCLLCYILQVRATEHAGAEY